MIIFKVRSNPAKISFSFGKKITQWANKLFSKKTLIGVKHSSFGALYSEIEFFKVYFGHSFYIYYIMFVLVSTLRLFILSKL